MDYVLIWGLGFVCYWNALPGPFIYDGRVEIASNEFLRVTTNPLDCFRVPVWNVMGSNTNLGGYYRPLINLSFWLDGHVWNFNPLGFHLTNLLLHLMVASFLYRLLVLLNGSRMSALLAALLCIAHPVNTEAVSWIDARGEPAVALSALAACLAFALGQNAVGGNRLWHGAVCVGWLIFGLLWKESAVILPLLLLLFLGTRPSRTPGLVLGIAATYLVAMGVYGYLRLAVAHTGLPTTPAGGMGDFGTRLLTAPSLFCKDLKLWFLPVHLNLFRFSMLTPVTSPLSPYFIGPMLLMAAIVGGIIPLWRRLGPLYGFALSWFVLGLAPVLNLVSLPQPGCERYMYIPSVGLCMLFGLLLGSRIERGQRALLWVAIVVLVAASAGTISRNFEWGDDVRFWESTVARTPDSLDARLLLGISYRDHRAFPQAIAMFQSLPEVAERYHQTAQTYLDMGDVQAALAQYQAGLDRKVEPQSLLLSQLGLLLTQRGRYSEAVVALQQSTRLKPDDTQGHYNLGIAYDRLQRYDEALGEFEEAVRLAPNYHVARNNLMVECYRAGHADEAAGRLPQARAAYRRFLQLWNGGQAERVEVEQRLSALGT